MSDDRADCWCRYEGSKDRCADCLLATAAAENLALVADNFRLNGEAMFMRDDNARLRALVKDAEWALGEHGECLWCPDDRPRHAVGCPAFTPEGVVK